MTSQKDSSAEGLHRKADAYLTACQLWLDDSGPEERYILASIVVDKMHAFAADVLHEVARAECKYCRRGDTSIFIPRSRVYMHRVPEGKNGGFVRLLCRATEVWRTSK